MSHADAAAHLAEGLTVPALPEAVVPHDLGSAHHEHHLGGDVNAAAVAAVVDQSQQEAEEQQHQQQLHHVSPPVAVDASGQEVHATVEGGEEVKLEGGGHALEGVAGLEDVEGAGGGLNTPKKRCRKSPLTFHEALTFASRGVYVDMETGQLRCSCNHKKCDKWDAYGYTRHFSFKVHKKYEAERLDDSEIARLRDAKAAYLRINPIVEETSIRKKRKMRDGEKILSVDELRVQERHWMEMWKDAKNELKQLRTDLKEEVDEEVRAEIMADIEGLRKRKGDWARLLGLNEVPVEHSAQL
mmetsp:Transcript_8616/g.14972  ORF Transcript_8616/g.14972 Transcript_8616/m.14972 type:complete len:299 (-) Transcript_8616:205-1101(-)|eukprot:CAMPEP_0183729036 /NCGR_PEP_ID=MMETSP0737-20130205/29550_1 /TAXON_ID=385413 /ORGANISM="Thalassiosira miniscula, Strain CCMP1093" /LENGTH=298 /DNA_ID=CAMNT_0025961131 /DNA_START=40 /DNA_END=936 /DNA_ORIENTATION=+